MFLISRVFFYVRILEEIGEVKIYMIYRRYRTCSFFFFKVSIMLWEYNEGGIYFVGRGYFRRGKNFIGF